MKIYVTLLIALVCQVSTKILPDYIPQCKRKDPDLAKCILQGVDKVKPYLMNGIPELKVPSYEPLNIPNLTVDRKMDAITVKASLNNMKTHGASAFKVKNLKVDLNKLTAELTVSLPVVQTSTDYDISGRLLAIPLAGKGFMEGNFTDITAISKGSGKIITKKGKEYLQLENFTSKLKIGNGKVRFIDKDGTTALIAETAAAFFNANPRLVLDIINPIIEDSADAILSAIIKRILGSAPLAEFLPDE